MTRWRRRALAAWTATVAAAAALMPTPAAAWKAYHTAKGAPLHWAGAATGASPGYSLDTTGLASDGLGPAAVEAAATGAFAAWASLTCPGCALPLGQSCQAPLCAAIALGVTPKLLGWAPPQPLGLGCAATPAGDCRDPQPNGNQITFFADASAWPFGTKVMAMTVVTALPADGAIGDADIAVNDAGFAFCAGDCAAPAVHLGGLLLHEAGHWLGLDHSADPAAWMYAIPPKELLGPGALGPDDRAGACAIYHGSASLPACADPADAAAGEAGADAAADGRGGGGIDDSTVIAGDVARGGDAKPAVIGDGGGGCAAAASGRRGGGGSSRRALWIWAFVVAAAGAPGRRGLRWLRRLGQTAGPSARREEPAVAAVCRRPVDATGLVGAREPRLAR